jgi:hypothetical protein
MRLACRLATLALVAALGLPLAACDEETVAPLVTIETPDPVRGIIVTTGFEGFQTDVWIAIPVAVGGRGKLDITIDWTSADTWMYVYFGDTACDYAQLSSGGCPFLITSETKEPKPRVFITDFVNPGTYYVVLYNVPRNPKLGIGSDNTEAVSLQIGLTVGFLEASNGEVPVKLGRPIVVNPPRL